MIVRWRIFHRPATLTAPSVFLGVVQAERKDEALDAGRQHWPGKTLDTVSEPAWALMGTRDRAIFLGTYVTPIVPTLLDPDTKQTVCTVCGATVVYGKQKGRWRNPPRYCDSPHCIPTVVQRVRKTRARTLDTAPKDT